MYYNDYKGVTIVGASELCNNIHLYCHAEFKNNEWRIVWELSDGLNGYREILEKEQYSEYLSEQEECSVSNLTLFISQTIYENTIRERWESTPNRSLIFSS